MDECKLLQCRGRQVLTESVHPVADQLGFGTRRTICLNLHLLSLEAYGSPARSGDEDHSVLHEPDMRATHVGALCDPSVSAQIDHVRATKGHEGHTFRGAISTR